MFGADGGTSRHRTWIANGATAVVVGAFLATLLAELLVGLSPYAMLFVIGFMSLLAAAAEYAGFLYIQPVALEKRQRKALIAAVFGAGLLLTGVGDVARIAVLWTAGPLFFLIAVGASLYWERHSV